MTTRRRRGTWAEIRSLGVLGRAWALGVIIFSLARALVAWPTLGRYGVDPWLFLTIDIVTAPPYGIGQAVAVKIIRDPTQPARNAVGWALLVILAFIAPYLYIFLASGSMPLVAYILVLGWMLLFGALALWRMIRQVRSPIDQPKPAAEGPDI